MTKKKPSRKYALIATRFELAQLYADIVDACKRYDWKISHMFPDRARKPELNHDQEKVFMGIINDLPVASRYMMRFLNDRTRFWVNEDMTRVGQILNELLPRIQQMDKELAKTNTMLKPLGEDLVITAEELVFEHLAKEDPIYLRKLFSASLMKDDFLLTNAGVDEPLQHELQSVRANWLLTGTSEDTIVLKGLTRLDNEGHSAEIKVQRGKAEKTGVPRIDYMLSQMPALTHLSRFVRSSSHPFSRFVTGLYTVLMGIYPRADADIGVIDGMMDVAELATDMHREMQSNAKEANRIWIMFHHGYPVYADLHELATSQYSLMHFTAEGLVLFMSYLLPELLKLPQHDDALLNLLLKCGVVETYARHRKVHIKRT